VNNLIGVEIDVEASALHPRDPPQPACDVFAVNVEALNAFLSWVDGDERMIAAQGAEETFSFLQISCDSFPQHPANPSLHLGNASFSAKRSGFWRPHPLQCTRASTFWLSTSCCHTVFFCDDLRPIPKRLRAYSLPRGANPIGTPPRQGAF